jgi:hypothetical protein
VGVPPAAGLLTVTAVTTIALLRRTDVARG